MGSKGGAGRHGKRYHHSLTRWNPRVQPCPTQAQGAGKQNSGLLGPGERTKGTGGCRECSRPQSFGRT